MSLFRDLNDLTGLWVAMDGVSSDHIRANAGKPPPARTTATIIYVVAQSAALLIVVSFTRNLVLVG